MRSTQLTSNRSSPTRGLFDGFEGYRTPSEDDNAAALKHGLVVVDTNVLLNLYRYSDQTRTDLLAVLRVIGPRLWVPHQVVAEFWRNRGDVLLDPRETQKTAKAFEAQLESALQTLRTWANRVSLSNSKREQLETSLKAAFTLTINGVQELEDDDNQESLDTNLDPVVSALADCLATCVGEPLSDEEFKTAKEEGLRRIANKEPPGYSDATKNPDHAIGDYLVWRQLLKEASVRKVDVVLVTGDVKEDWWRKEHNQIRGPRPELVQELKRHAGVRLFMVRPEGLLLRARSVLSLDVKNESLKDVERVDKLLANEEPVNEGIGWTAESIRYLLGLLARNAPVQEAVIRFAAKRDGFVSREEVFEIGDYEPGRQLKGFTRPVNRMTQQLKDLGQLPDSALDVLSAVYDQSSDAFGQAIGFRVPEELLKLIRGAEGG